MIRAGGVLTALYRQFGRLPEPLRHFIVGLTTPAHRVGAAGVVTHQGKMLLCRHSYRPGWSLPGGMMAWKEKPLEAVLREVREETGIETVVVGEAFVYTSFQPRRVEFVYDLRLCEGEDPSGAVAASPEIEEARWFDLAEPPALSRRTEDLLSWMDDVREERRRWSDNIS